ncbi:type II restriction endonuclease [Anaeromyxobacter oryzisoli]|uniref:type II restriction endonuclease n=1 Tax=Anaeromyxobacter oryzisoli TaxID=2925408 RepID=UPI001F58A1A9|nr:type II restriction endonuclease [Anaeromyxobacter sp. SG63]
MRTAHVRELVERWRDDPGGTYRTWFLWEERLKNFRSIRRGIAVVVNQIEAGTFGTTYKGSALETVVGSIAEQRQIFKGADHAFLWKPKLRIPDIYEDRENQLAFGRFLDTCACCTGEEQVLAAIRRLDERRIKGLGPAAANLLYFLHPTIAVPFNTAIVRGYDALTGSKVKLGRWDEYLAMRAGVLRLNAEHQALFSNDLGAIAGFLFDVGSGRYPLPSRDGDEAAEGAWRADLARVREESERERRSLEAVREGDRTHTEVQGWLRDLGRALGFDVWVATNDRTRASGAGRLADGCLESLPAPLAAIDSVPLIDVLWLERGSDRAAAAFEVEHTTSIYSGIVRMLDLASGAAQAVRGLYLVAPDAREEDVRKQLARPAFRRIGDLAVKYLPYSALEQHRESMARFGEGLKAVDAVARALG